MTNSTDEWFDKGNAYFALGKYKEAIKCYDKVIKIDPKRALVWTGKGHALNLLGKYKDAIECYDNAIKINSQDSNTWTMKGLSPSGLGQRDEAIEAWYGKGIGLQKLHRDSEAESAFTKAKELGCKY
jgi:tetratricopeptide (TPR) repeat protein